MMGWRGYKLCVLLWILFVLQAIHTSAQEEGLSDGFVVPSYFLREFDPDCVRSEQQDIIIVLDSSASIARADFKKQLQFVNSLIEKISIGPTANQVGVVSFSDNYRLNFNLNANREKEKLQRAVSAIRQIGGGTSTHKPLEYVKRNMFTASRGDRPDKKNVCVVITDGQSYEPELTARAAGSLREDNVQMFALGVGEGVDRTELDAISGDPDRTFMAKSFDELNVIIEGFSTSVLGNCENDEAPPAPKIIGTPETAVEVGASIELRCVSETTSSDAEIAWFRNNDQVPNTNYKIEGAELVSYLRFNAAKEDGQAVYECLLRHPLLDDGGLSAETSFEVMLIPGEPQITYNPSRIVLDGTMTTLTCTSLTDDVANTEVVWIKSRVRVEGQTIEKGADFMRNVIIFPASLADNQARYECRVFHTNLPEPLVAYSDLTVTGLPKPPSISADPAGPVRAGSRVTLTCISEGTDSNTQVIWYRNGRPLDRTYYISGLVVRNDLSITATSTREYECRVSHPELPSSLTATHTLATYSPPQPPRIGLPPPVYSADSSITLMCTASQTDELTELIWVKDGRDIDSSFVRDEDDGTDMSNEHVFSSMADIEGAHCEARHTLLETPLKAYPPQIVIEVKKLPGPPEINDGVPIPSQKRDSQVELVCKSVGTDSETQVVWYESSPSGFQVVDSSFEIEGEFLVNRLTVSAVQNGPTYECRVSHPFLEEYKEARVKISVFAPQGPPRISGIPSSAVYPGTRVTLQCRSEGIDPSYKLYWLKSDVVVDQTQTIDLETGYIVNEYEFETGESHTNLVCQRIRPESTTEDVIFAYGVVSVITMSTPTISQEPSTAVHGEKVTLFCSALHNDMQGIKLEWYLNGRLVDDTQFRTAALVVNELEVTVDPEKMSYTCSLQHQQRKQDVAYRIVVALPRPIITGAPESAIPLGTPVLLQCSWPAYDPTARLFWRDARANNLIDQSFSISNGMMVNELETTVSETTVYECSLETDGGSPALPNTAEKLINVTTTTPELDKPTITQEPEAAEHGKGVKLICQALHFDLQGIRLEWYQANQLIDSSYYNTDLYVVNELEVKASPSNRELKCVVRYGVKSEETTHPLKIDKLPPPTITILDDGTAIIPGSGVELTCTWPDYDLTSQARLVWVDPTGREVDSFFTHDGGYMINERVVRVYGDMVLTCIVSGLNSSSTTILSDTAAITVTEEEEVTNPDVGQVPPAVLEGESVTLICSIPSLGTSDQQLNWYGSGMLKQSTITTDLDYIVAELVVDPARVDVTDYECQHSVAGKTTVVPHQLVVVEYAPPTITGQPQAPVPEGSNFDALCTWPHVDPDARLIWFNSLTGEMVDSTYTVAQDRTINALTMPAARSQVVECRVLGIGLIDKPLLERIRVPVVQEPPALSDCEGGGGKIDVIVILDSSTSIVRSDFMRQLEFIQRFVDAFTIGFDNVRVGIISFSNEYEINFHLNQYGDRDSLHAAIGNIKQMGGGTNTHLPIQAARTIMFSAENGDRPEVPDLLIIMTDGQSYEPDLTAEQARLTRETGVDIYAIGVGVGVDFEELNSITNRTHKVYFAEDYRALETIENEFVLAAQAAGGDCNRPTPITTPQTEVEWSPWSGCSKTCGSGVRIRYKEGCSEIDCTQSMPCMDTMCPSEPEKPIVWPSCMTVIDQADIALLLDTSSSVYEPDFDKMKLFLTDFIDLFNVTRDKQRISALTFSDDVRVNFHLNDHFSNDLVKQAILRIGMHLGGTQTAEAIHFMRTDLFTESNGARMNSPKIGFVITDGRSHEPAKTAAQADLARQAGVILYSIGIGPATDEAELEEIAGNWSRVYLVDSYDDINKLKQRIGIDLSACYNPNATVDGGYGAWTEWAECSVTCGTGVTYKVRVCDSPAPRNGGRHCHGDSRKEKSCRMYSCTDDEVTTPLTPEPQGWTEWEYSTACSVSCGQGVQEITRYCQYETNCNLGDVEKKMIPCQMKSCQDNDTVCGGHGGVNVMFATQNINNNGPNAYYTVQAIKDISQSLPIDGKNVKTSLTVGECACSRDQGYDLYRHRTFTDVMTHLERIDLHDTYSLLSKVKKDHQISPSPTGPFGHARIKPVLVLFLDENDVISPRATEEAQRLKLAGVEINIILMSPSVHAEAARLMASSPSHIWIYDYSSPGFTSILDEILQMICN